MYWFHEFHFHSLTEGVLKHGISEPKRVLNWCPPNLHILFTDPSQIKGRIIEVLAN